MEKGRANACALIVVYISVLKDNQTDDGRKLVCCMMDDWMARKYIY